MNLPKFVWRFRLRSTSDSAKSNLQLTNYNNIELDFLYDATALRGKHELIAIICYTKEANEFFNILKTCYSATADQTKLSSLILTCLDNTLQDDKSNGPTHNLKDFFKEIELSETNKIKDNMFGMEKFCARPPKTSEQENHTKQFISSKELSKKKILPTIDAYLQNLHDHFKINLPNSKNDENTFIWLINVDGELLIAHEDTKTEVGKRGHFALAIYHKARFAGEFIVRIKSNATADSRESIYEIEFNSNSASYSLDFNQYHSTNCTEIENTSNSVFKTLQNALDLINPTFQLHNLKLNIVEKIYYKANVQLFSA